MRFFLFGWSLFVWVCTAYKAHEMQKEFSTKTNSFFKAFIYFPFGLLKGVLMSLYIVFAACIEDESKGTVSENLAILMIGLIHTMAFYVPLILIIVFDF
jgi:hypothetical protein